MKRSLTTKIIPAFTLLTVVVLTACTSVHKPAITRENWGTVDAKPVYLYTLTNANGLTAKITNYGCIIVAFQTPDRNGQTENIVIGLSSLDDYLAGHPYFGSIVGRYADLVEDAGFSLDGIEYKLSGAGHGGLAGFDKKVWDATISSDRQSATLSLTYLSPDKEEGYPGNLSVQVDYVLNNDNELQIHYTATTDKPTVLNLTNHSYFNLTGCKEDVRGHQVVIYADTYTPYSDERNIPTGEFAPVEGTPFDLRRWTILGDRFAELPIGCYDHCFCVDGAPGNPVLAAELYDPKSGRLLQTYTTEPGLQLYAACFLDGSLKNAQNIPLTQYMGACFEAQHFANSPNTPSFPTTVLRPGETFRHTTVYKAGIVQQTMQPLSGNPSRPVTYDTTVRIAEQFESFDVPAKIHPRTYLRPEDVPGIKAKMMAPQPITGEYLNKITASANDAGFYDNSRRPLPTRENGSNHDGRIVESAMNRALLYVLDPEANATKGREAITMAINYLSTWRNASVGNYYGRGNQAASILHNFSCVYDWTYDLMTPEERQTFIGKIIITHPEAGIHEGETTDDPNNKSYGLMRALSLLEMSTSGDSNTYLAWENSFRVSSQNAHNGHHLEASVPAVTAFAIAVYDEYPYAWELVSTWLYDNIFPTSNFLLEAGMPWQGAAYGTARLTPLSQANMMIYQMQAPDNRKSCFTPNIVDAAHSFIYYRRPDGQYARMGDKFLSSRDFGVPHSGSEPEFMMFVNKIFRDPYVQKELLFLRTQRQIPSALGFLLWPEDVKPASSFERLPTAYYSPYPNGEMVHFTGWRDGIDFNSNILHMDMKIGDFRAWNHEHLDYGTFQIYYKGALAVDAGVYEGSTVTEDEGSGFGSKSETGWDKSTISHNAFLIRDPKMDERTSDDANPGEQEFNYRGRRLGNSGGHLFSWNGQGSFVRNLYRIEGIPSYITNNPNATTEVIRGKTIAGKGPVEGNIPTAEVLSHYIPKGTKPSYTYLKGSMSELFSYRAEMANRSFLSLDFNNDSYPGALIVFDRIVSGNKYGDGAQFAKYWLLHSMNKPDILTDANGHIDNIVIKRTETVKDPYKYNGQLIETPLLPVKGDLTVEVVYDHIYPWYPEGSPYRYYRSGSPRYNQTGNKITEEDGRWMLMISPKEKKLTDLMLNVMQVSDAGTKPLPVALIGKETDAMVGANIYDCVAMFSTNGKLINNAVVIPSAGNAATLKYHIADLSGGEWTVMNDRGAKICEFSVDGEGNIGTFTAPGAHAYTISPKVSGEKTRLGVDTKKIEAIIQNMTGKEPSEHNTDWFGTMPLAGLLSWHKLGYYPEMTDYVTKWLDYHYETNQTISDGEFHSRTSAIRATVFREYTLLLAAYCGYPGLNFVCGPLYELTGNEMARQVCKDVGDLIINHIPRNELGMLLDDDQHDTHAFTLPDAAYFYVPALFIAAKAYDREVQAGDAAAKEKQDQLIAFAGDQLKKFTDLFLDREKKITKTVYRNGRLGDTFWTRANGWLLWMIVDATEHLDKNGELYDYACKVLDLMAQGIADFQDTSGALHLLVDEADTPLETSGTIMAAYGIHKAVRMGWIDRKYLDIAEKAWNYVDTMLDYEGVLSGSYSSWAIPAEERDLTSFGPIKSVIGMLITTSAEFEKPIPLP